MSPTHRSSAAAAGLLLLLAAGCSTGHHASSAATRGPAAASAAQATAAPRRATPVTILRQYPLPNPATIRNLPAKRTAVAITTCRKAHAGWVATGTARNRGRAPARYDITVFFTTDQATTIDLARTRVRVAPGRLATWSAAAAFRSTGHLHCVLRGVG